MSKLKEALGIYEKGRNKKQSDLERSAAENNAHRQLLSELEADYPQAERDIQKAVEAFNPLFKQLIEAGIETREVEASAQGVYFNMGIQTNFDAGGGCGMVLQLIGVQYEDLWIPYGRRWQSGNDRGDAASGIFGAAWEVKLPRSKEGSRQDLQFVLHAVTHGEDKKYDGYLVLKGHCRGIFHVSEVEQMKSELESVLVKAIKESVRRKN